MSLFASMREKPFDERAEQALLGAILTNLKAYDRVSGFLRPEHFHVSANGRIYDAVARRIEAGGHPDSVSLASDLVGSPDLDAAGGVAYLGKLMTSMVGILNAGEYGRVIRDCWHRRCLIDVATEMFERSHHPDGKSATEIQEVAEGRLFEIAERGGEDVSVDAHQAMSESIDAAAKASQLPGGLVGLTTGYRELDDLTGGWRRGSYNLLAARPSMGKTSLALGMAAAAAATGARVLFASLEMSYRLIGAKLTAGLSQTPIEGAERGRIRERDGLGRFTYTPINTADLDRMMAAQKAMASRTLIIDECRQRTMSALRSSVRRMRRRQGLDLVLLDYLGLMTWPELARSDNRTLEMTKLSAACKALAIDLDVPVVVLAQLNRGTEGREDKRPTLSDLRDSGALEQDADVVGFLYREHYYLKRHPPERKLGETDEKFSSRQHDWHEAETRSRGGAEVILAKQRMGATGSAKLRFMDDYAWFGDWE